MRQLQKGTQDMPEHVHDAAQFKWSQSMSCTKHIALIAHVNHACMSHRHVLAVQTTLCVHDLNASQHSQMQHVHALQSCTLVMHIRLSSPTKCDIHTGCSANRASAMCSSGGRLSCRLPCREPRKRCWNCQNDFSHPNLNSKTRGHL